ncbi:MAG TPA: HAD-IC family P-type ATPase, partial [Acidimicrobiia bacterium]
MHRPGTEGIADAVERALLAIEGVHWAEVNAILARVAVAFDGDVVAVDDLVTAIEEAEDSLGVGAGDLLGDRPDHPGDADAIRWGVVEVGADIAGIAVGGIARLLRWPVLPVEIAAALPAIDSLPPVRRVLDLHRGIEAAVVSASALLQGLGAGPVGLVVDATHRVTLLSEAMARRAVWDRAESGLHAGPSDDRVAAFERVPRPVALPDGPLETYAQRVAFGSLGAGGLAFALTRDPRRTADVLLAAVPRAARFGRESFAASAGRVLAGRDVVPMDARVLRRLDRIDTVVVDAELLDEPSAPVRTLLEAVHAAAQDLVIAGTPSDGAHVADADLVVAGGEELAASVRALQTEGRVVAVVSARPGEALAAADCGIGLCIPGGRPPWGAHLLCPTLYDAALVIEATAVARTASGQAVRIAMAGSAVAALLALGPLPLAGRRAVLAANAAALTAIAVGTWTGASLNGRLKPRDDREPVTWHSLSVAEVVARLGTNSTTGLDAGEADGRRVEAPSDRHTTFGALFVKELSNPLTVLLGAGGVLSTVAGSFSDGLLISGVLGVNAFIGAAQRLQTEQAIRKLTASVSGQVVRIRRGGTELSISPSELVDGDVVLLQAGDIVPADTRIIIARGVETDESALTGESLPVAKHVDAVASDTAVADRTSIAYAGTAIAAGRAEAVVVATGNRTEAGRAGDDGAGAPVTGVEARLDDLTRRTVPLVLAAGATLTGVTLLRGGPAREAISTGVSLAAAAVPEGLPFLATVAQSGAARRLSTKGVLVRNPRVLEALGRVDVLCFDKTGTLTEGQLQVRSVSDGDIVETLPAIDGRRRLVLAAALRATPQRRREGLPHPTDQAVVDGADAVELSGELGAPGWHKAASLPFASNRGYHAALGNTADGPVLSVKGAPEV